MAKFDSGTAVEALDFDFSAHGGPVGTVPEPSQEAMNRYLHDVGVIAEKAMAERGEQVDTSDPMAVMAALAKLDEKQAARNDDLMIDAVARLCGGRCVKNKWEGGEPTRAQVKALPARVRQAFVSWLMSELFNPEGAAAVSTSQEGPSGGSISTLPSATSN